jgi:cytoskeleton protein RodZ
MRTIFENANTATIQGAMSDQQEQQTSASVPTPGEWLRQERERQGRTVQQIATELHIGAYMIDAIESNQFSILGAPVFARGHLRKYAALLGLPVERVQELYQSLSDRPRDQDPVPIMHRETEPSIPMSPDSKQRRTLQRPAQWTFAIAGGALLLAGSVAWFLHMSPKPAEPAQESVVTAPVSTETTQVIDSGIAASNETPAVPKAADVKAPTKDRSVAAPNPAVIAERAPATATAPTTTTAPVTPVARGKLRLRFSFTQESWVEVYDARGTRMFYDVGFTGQTRGVDVEPPAQIVLGMASAVTTEANGREVNVPPRRVVNQVARFTVGADGAAQ